MAVERERDRERDGRKRVQQQLWKPGRRLLKLGKRTEKENDETLLSIPSLSLCDICPLNGISPTERSNKQWSGVKGGERERDSGGKKENRKGMNDSKEEKSDRMGRAVPARHCFTSHCTEEENLSYASAFHNAFTIYVPARIMQLDGSVEKTPINLILFSIFFFSPLFFLFQRPSNPLSLCSVLAFICSGLFPDFLCKGIQQQAFVSCIYCILLSL